MICPKCNSSDVRVQIVSEARLKDAHHGWVWWLCIGWWWIVIKWLFFTLPALIFKVFGHKKQKLVVRQKSVCVCQSCGYMWDPQNMKKVK